MCWEANCLGLINYFANIYANYRVFVCKITSKMQAIIFSGFALSYSYSLFTQNAIIEKRHPESQENHCWVVNSWGIFYVSLLDSSKIKYLNVGYIWILEYPG